MNKQSSERFNELIEYIGDKDFSINVIYTSFDESITVTVPDDVKASATATEIDE